MKHTTQMTAQDLARAYARHHGWIGTRSGWIRDTTGDPIVQGYDDLATGLTRLGILEPGVGIMWCEERTRYAGDGSKVAGSLRTGRRGGWLWT